MEQLVFGQEAADTPPEITATREQIQHALHAVYGLTLLHSILEDAAGQAVLDLLHHLTTSEPDPAAIATAYSRAFRELATTANRDATPALSDAWQAHLIGRLIDDSNLWSTRIEHVGPARISPALRAQARRDLYALQRLFQLGAEPLWQLACALTVPTMPVLQTAWEPWCDLAALIDNPPSRARLALAELAAQCTDWTELITPLEQHWMRHGTGLLAHYTMLRWQQSDEQLVGIAHPDPIQLTSLVGHERQQGRLTTNIERFLANLPAQDMLLYGPPGTGKSSTLKALVNTYAEQGLRLVELRKEDISDLPRVVALLRGRAPHYLLFIDDLSFEEHETAYKVLKVLLEGTAEARPANVLICATTNRINLVREHFSERGTPASGDAHWRDTMDEKQSLVHRFGLRVTFTSPDQQQYLQIVSELVRQRGLSLPEETLQTRALFWERQHVGRSGRVARQFVDDLEAELKYSSAHNR